MTLPRLTHSTRIADSLNLLAAIVKSRSRAGLTDANRVLENISARFFNTLFGWNLVNLNSERANTPAADLGDLELRIAVQVTNEERSAKIKDTIHKAVTHGSQKQFDRLIIFFLLPKAPKIAFVQPINGPIIEVWDIPAILTQLQTAPNFDTLARTATVLDEELGNIGAPQLESIVDRMLYKIGAQADQLAVLKVDLLAALQRVQEAERDGFLPAKKVLSDLRRTGNTALLSKFLDEQLSLVDSFSIDLLRERGSVALLEQDYSKAEELFRRILILRPGDFESVFKVLLVLVKEKRMWEAEHWLANIRSMEDRTEREKLDCESWMWSYFGEWSKLEPLVSRRLELDEEEGYNPDNIHLKTMTLLTLANLKIRRNDPTAARSLYQKAIELYRTFGLESRAKAIEEMIEVSLPSGEHRP